MSSQIDILAVDGAGLQAAVANRDLTVFKAIANVKGAVFPVYGGELSKSDITLALLGNPPARRALKNILRGKVGHQPAPALYVGAYYGLCSHFSTREFQDWNHVGRAARWLDEIDDALKHRGLDIDLLKLIYGPKMLIDIPQADPDEVNTGYWSRDDIVKFKAEIEKYFASDYFETDSDRFRRLGYPLHTIHKWLEYAQAEGAVLVGFYS